MADVHEDLVADLVPQAVVDGLEVVDVEIEQRERSPVAPGTLELVGRPRAEAAREGFGPSGL